MGCLSQSKDYLKDQLGDKSKVKWTKFIVCTIWNILFSLNHKLDRIHDHLQVFQKPPLKENTKPVEFKLHTQQRAVKRAMFNYSVRAHS